MSMPSNRPLAKRRGWPVALAALLLVSLGGSLVAVLVNSRTVKGSIPGKAALLSLAVTPSGYLIGTADGALFSAEGNSWARVPDFGGTTLVANNGTGAVLVNGGAVYGTRDLTTFARVGAAPDGVVGLSAHGAAELIFATGTGRFFRGAGGQELLEIQARGGPRDVVTLSVAGPAPTLLAGGLSSGLWLSEDGGLAWTRLLGTPTRSALLDNRQAGRTFIATAGGVLTSADGREWSFTNLREPVEALAQSPDAYWAVSASRVLYESADGLTWRAKTLPE